MSDRNAHGAACWDRPTGDTAIILYIVANAGECNMIALPHCSPSDEQCLDGIPFADRAVRVGRETEYQSNPARGVNQAGQEYQPDEPLCRIALAQRNLD